MLLFDLAVGTGLVFNFLSILFYLCCSHYESKSGNVQGPGFDPGSVRMGFVVDKVVLRFFSPE
jgi:hypothetical protein